MPAKNPTEYYRAYREKRKVAGNPVASGKSGQRLSKFRRGLFIAWDGEGWTTNERVDSFTYNHHFVLFANSAGDTLSILPDEKQLSTEKCLAFLVDSGSRYPTAINVVYGGSYDMNHILRDLSYEEIQELSQEGSIIWHGYYIELKLRRSLYVRKGKDSITLWDVIGFFQMTFVQAIEEWLGKDYPDLEFIREGKKQREHFQSGNMDFMQEYNQRELSALVLLMERFHKAANSLGLTLSRWDGAGAVAAAILKKKRYKECLADAPKTVEYAARCAYFGGRFELGQYGKSEGTIYGYDINSAYPTIFRSLPNLAKGVWRKIDNPVSSDVTDFSLVYLRWNYPTLRFGPFPYRDPHGLVSYPTVGENWVYGVEYRGYLERIPDTPDETVEILKLWRFESDTHDEPFSWVEDYYNERQKIVNGESELPYGCQMVLKLGLNSLYGKTAQSLGYDPEKKVLPPYHCLLYAGYITAATRSKLWRAAMQNPDAIIMMATDGIYSSAPLDLPVSETKKLGLWENKLYDFILSVMSGIYVLGKNGRFTWRRRGIDDESGSEYFIERCMRHWRNPRLRYETMPIEQTRLIGIKSAAISPDMYRRLGCWYTFPLNLQMHPGPTTKRQIDTKSANRKPHAGLVHTMPSLNMFYIGSEMPSTPYERPWDRDTWLWIDEEELYEIGDAINA